MLLESRTQSAAVFDFCLYWMAKLFMAQTFAFQAVRLMLAAEALLLMKLCTERGGSGAAHTHIASHTFTHRDDVRGIT